MHFCPSGYSNEGGGGGLSYVNICKTTLRSRMTNNHGGSGRAVDVRLVFLLTLPESSCIITSSLQTP